MEGRLALVACSSKRDEGDAAVQQQGGNHRQPLRDLVGEQEDHELGQ